MAPIDYDDAPQQQLLSMIPPELHLRILHYTILLRSSALTNYLAANPMAQHLMAAHCCLIFGRAERQLVKDYHVAHAHRDACIASSAPNRLAAFFAADDKCEALIRERERVRALHAQMHTGCGHALKEPITIARPRRYRFWELPVAA